VVNFFGFYLDPVYILILTVFIIAGFMGTFIWQLRKMATILQDSLKEAQISEAMRVVREENRVETKRIMDGLAAQTAELKQHIYSNGGNH
jgi:predicted Co/Zn/Cd cation transporter (cation efflux family)